MCNCGKGKKQIINNTRNQEVLNLVNETYSRLIQDKTIEEIGDLDWIEIYSVWRLLYPNANGTPSQQKVITDLDNSRQFLKIKYK